MGPRFSRSGSKCQGSQRNVSSFRMSYNNSFIFVSFFFFFTDFNYFVAIVCNLVPHRRVRMFFSQYSLLKMLQSQKQPYCFSLHNLKQGCHMDQNRQFKSLYIYVYLKSVQIIFPPICFLFWVWLRKNEQIFSLFSAKIKKNNTCCI